MSQDNTLKRRNWRLYSLLDVPDQITAKQVKWNFRKVTLRRQYHEAYLVLSNSARKYLYDSIGENAFGFIICGTWGPLIPLLGAIGTVVLYCIFMMLQVLLLIVFFVLLGLRVDDSISSSWKNVLIPLVIFVILMLLATFFALVVNFASSQTYREGMVRADRISPVGNFFAAAAYACFVFLLTYLFKEDPEHQVGNYLRYFSLLIAGDVLYYATSLIWRFPQRIRMQMCTPGKEPGAAIGYTIFFMAFIHMACSIVQWVLIGEKIDQKIPHWSWYGVFFPTCIRAGIRVVEAYLRSLMKYKISVRNKCGVAFDTIGSFFSNGILLISLYFVAVRIECGKECPMLRALIPVFVTLAYIFICLLITMKVLLSRIRHTVRTERRINRSGILTTDGEGNGALSTAIAPVYKQSDEVGALTKPNDTALTVMDMPYNGGHLYVGNYDGYFPGEEELGLVSTNMGALMQSSHRSSHNNDSLPLQATPTRIEPLPPLKKVQSIHRESINNQTHRRSPPDSAYHARNTLMSHRRDQQSFTDEEYSESDYTYVEETGEYEYTDEEYYEYTEETEEDSSSAFTNNSSVHPPKQ